MVPQAVHSEVVEVGKREGYPEATVIEGFERDGWITIRPLRAKSKRMALFLAETLGIGEAESIALANDLEVPLLIDDDQGRRLAKYYRVDTVSTLGIMLEFLLSSKISKEEYVANVRRYSSQAWIGADVVQEFLRRGELV